MENFGRVIWKLAQLGILVLLVGLGVLMVLKPAEAEDGARDEKNMQTESGKGSGGGGLIRKLKELFGGGERDVTVKTGSSGNKGKSESALAASQRELAEGHIDLEKLLELADVHKEIGLLAEGTTQVQQMLFWEIVGDNVYYRIVLTPYDRRAHELMMDPSEALFMSFISADNKRVVPISAAYRIPTKKMRVATKDGYAVGWFYDGKMSLEDRDPNSVDHGKVGWIFSGTLHGQLKKIQKPAGANRLPVSDPHGIKTGVDGR